MKTSDIADPIFLKAVQAIDGGDVAQLELLVNDHPYLVSERLDYNSADYFDRPYLLWFIADNPIRNKTLPANIVLIANKLITAVQRYAPATAVAQLEYALGLVATGATPREQGVQIELIDVLINHGASAGGVLGALAHNNIDAAKHILARGGRLDLATAAGLNKMDDVKRLLPKTTHGGQLTALTVAAFFGNADMVSYLLEAGVNANGYPEKDQGFHAHGTPLHQAVSCGSLECVRLLVEGHARTDVPDLIFKATPLGWAQHLQTGDMPEAESQKYKVIEDYLRATV
jgi:hypothetical protein